MSRLQMIVGALFVLLSGCASGTTTVGGADPAVFSNKDPAADLSAYRSYGYLQPLGTDESEGVRSLLSTFLINAMDGEMERRGFRRSDNPDLHVNFYLHTQEKLTAGSSRVVRRYRRARYGQWPGYQPTPLEYTEGTLTIDLVDARRNVVVWQGLAQGPLRGDLQDVTQERVHEVVSLILEEFTTR